MYQLVNSSHSQSQTKNLASTYSTYSASRLAFYEIHGVNEMERENAFWDGLFWNAKAYKFYLWW